MERARGCVYACVIVCLCMHFRCNACLRRACACMCVVSECVCMSVCMHVSTSVCIHACTSVCACVCVCVCGERGTATSTKAAKTFLCCLLYSS
jgi:hypothetical protein